MLINRKGFTLIEMLVVIAVVGILSATVLTALGPARNKAKDSRIIAGVNQARAIAETLYDNATSQYPDSVCSGSNCANKNLNIASSEADIAAQGGNLKITCGNGTTDNPRRQCAFSSTLNGGGNYCIDTTGGTSSREAQPGGKC